MRNNKISVEDMSQKTGQSGAMTKKSNGATDSPKSGAAKRVHGIRQPKDDRPAGISTAHPRVDRSSVISSPRPHNIGGGEKNVRLGSPGRLVQFPMFDRLTQSLSYHWYGFLGVLKYFFRVIKGRLM